MACGNVGLVYNAAGIPVFRKDPGDRLDYGFDWGILADPWLAQGETITAATWAFSKPAGADDLTLEAPSIAGGTSFVWVSGGTAGKDYVLTVHITTSAGRQAERSLILQVRQR